MLSKRYNRVPPPLLIEYRFSDPDLLTKALLHPSHPNANPNDCQFGRFELLGDSVLSLIVTEYLLASTPRAKTGWLTTRRAALVSNESCLRIAKFIKLDSHLKVQDNGSKKSKILADGVEAVLGAVFTDGGMEACRKIVTKSWIPFLLENAEGESDNYNYKKDLQEWLHLQPADGRFSEPRYSFESAGSDIEPEFKCVVKLGENKNWRCFSGCGRNKKNASQMAAKAAMKNSSRMRTMDK
jgi:ribonuclease-3